MSKKKQRWFKVLRGIERDGEWRFLPGETITEHDIKGAPIERWLETGVLDEVTDGDG
jgi:hypothetical protein